MYNILPSIMVCSKCDSKNIVAPCNEDGIDFRCLDCGHEKPHDPTTINTSYSEGVSDEIRTITI